MYNLFIYIYIYICISARAHDDATPIRISAQPKQVLESMTCIATPKCSLRILNLNPECLKLVTCITVHFAARLFEHCMFVHVASGLMKSGHHLTPTATIKDSKRYFRKKYLFKNINFFIFIYTY